MCRRQSRPRPGRRRCRRMDEWMCSCLSPGSNDDDDEWSVVDDRANRLPIVHQVERLVDLFQRQRVRDEGGQLNAAGHCVIDHAGQFGAAPHPPKPPTPPPPPPPPLKPPHGRPVTGWTGRVRISCPAPATPMITLSPQPLWQHSSAARITSTLPMHSKENSTPPSVISTITSWIGLAWSFGFTQSVAPMVRAKSNLPGLVSTPMMRPARASLAPCISARPMPPSPNTATVSPGLTLAVFFTAPRPVVTPQPSRHTCSWLAAGLIFASEISLTTVYSLNVEQPM